LAGHGKGSRKAARKNSGIRKAQSVSSEDSENYEGSEEGAGDEEDVNAKEGPVEEEDSNAEEDVNEEEDVSQPQELVEAGAENGKVRSTTSVATKDHARNQQRPSAPLRQAATSSITAPNKVISFDPETLRQGFLAGGAKLTDGKLASSTSSE
jgi:hypothetical protein